MRKHVFISLVIFVIAFILGSSFVYFFLKPEPAKKEIGQKTEKSFKETLMLPPNNAIYYKAGVVIKNDLRVATFIYLFNECGFSGYGKDSTFLLEDTSTGSNLNQVLDELNYKYNEHPLKMCRKEYFDEEKLYYRDPNSKKPAVCYFITNVQEMSSSVAVIKCGYHAGGKAALVYDSLYACRCSDGWVFFPVGQVIIC